MRSNPRSLARLGSVLVLAACGGGSDPGGTTTPDTPGPPASLAIALPSAGVAIGDTATATAVVRDASGRTVSAAVTWSSSAPNIATVNAATGLVRGVALGNAQITASTTGGSAPSGTAALTVKAPSAATVSMFPQSFSPVSLVLARGGVVTFDFPIDIDHNVIFPKQANGQPVVPGAPADIPTASANRGKKITRTFATTGTFTYDCTVHPGMTGEVIVVP